MKRILMLVMACICLQTSFAQSIEINKQFPFGSWPFIASEFKKNAGKYVIIDLFSSGCVLCFQTLPKINEWQQKYAAKLKFILVGHEDGEIANTYNRFEKKFNLQFPVFFDSLFSSYTGTRFYPTYIWINESGKVIAITGARELNEKNIQRFVEGGTIFQFNQQKVMFDSKIPYLHNRNDGDDSILIYRTLLTTWKEGQPILIPTQVDKQSNLFQALGARPEHLYRYAFSGSNLWEPDDSLYGIFFPIPVFSDESLLSLSDFNDQRFCISILVPDQSQVLPALQETLNRGFPFTAKLETRLMPYWSICVLNDDTLKLASKGMKRIGKTTHSTIDVTNYSIRKLIRFLHKYYQGGIPIIDETGISGLIDLTIEGVFTTYQSLKEALQQGGLDLIEKKRAMKVVVLYEKAPLAPSGSYGSRGAEFN